MINHLRIGNYVHSKFCNSDYKIEGLIFRSSKDLTILGKEPSPIIYTSLQVSQSDILDWSPIIINENWLFKFGFTYFNQSNIPMLFRISLDSERQLRWDAIDGLRIETKYSGWSWLLPHIKYVHELQNLYFCLTNKEFEVTLLNPNKSV